AINIRTSAVSVYAAARSTVTIVHVRFAIVTPARAIAASLMLEAIASVRVIDLSPASVFTTPTESPAARAVEGDPPAFSPIAVPVPPAVSIANAITGDLCGRRGETLSAVEFWLIRYAR